MASLNKVMLIGNLGRDPDIRYTQGGDPVANFSIAVTEKWTDKSGQKQENTEWMNIVAWKRLAELCKEYLTKGSPVLIEGKLQTRKWQTRDGEDRKTTEIVASNIVFLGSSRQSNQAPANRQDYGEDDPMPEDDDSSIPF